MHGSQLRSSILIPRSASIEMKLSATTPRTRYLSTKGKERVIEREAFIQYHSNSMNAHAGCLDEWNDRAEGSSAVLSTMPEAPSQNFYHNSMVTTQLLRTPKFYDHYPTTPRLPPLLVKSTIPLTKSRRFSKSTGKSKAKKIYRKVAATLPRNSLTSRLSPEKKASMSTQEPLPPDIPLGRIPISHGFGDAKQRAERCRETFHERRENVKSILDGLAGESLPKGNPEMRQPGHWGLMSLSSPGSGPPIGKICGGRRAYSTQASKTENVDDMSQTLPPITDAQRRQQDMAREANSVMSILEMIVDPDVKFGMRAESTKEEKKKKADDDEETDRSNLARALSDHVGHDLRGSRMRRTGGMLSNNVTLPLRDFWAKNSPKKIMRKADPESSPRSWSGQTFSRPPLTRKLPSVIATLAKHSAKDGETSDRDREVISQSVTPTKRRLLVDAFTRLRRQHSSTKYLHDLRESVGKKQQIVLDPVSEALIRLRRPNSPLLDEKKRQILLNSALPDHVKRSLLSKAIKNNLRSRIVGRITGKQTAGGEGLASLSWDVASSMESETEKQPQLVKPKESQDSGYAVVGTLQCQQFVDGILEDVVPPHGHWPIPRLAHGLDRALFNQTVHWLQDPHSRVFNFSPALQNLPHVTEFAFERLPKFKPSSQDEDLQSLAVQHSKRFVGSTSSLTRILAHIYFLLSGDREVDTSTLSMAFANKPRTFTPALRYPHTFTLSHQVHPIKSKPDTGNSEESEAPSMRMSQGLINEDDALSSEAIGSLKRDGEAQCLKQTDNHGPMETKESMQDGSHDLNHETDTSGSGETTQNGSESVSDTPTSKDAIATRRMVDLFAFWAADPSLRTNAPGPDETPRPKATTPSDKEAGPCSTKENEVPKQNDLERSPSLVERMVLSKLRDPQLSNPNPCLSHTTYSVETGFHDDIEARREMELNILLWLGTMTEKFLTLPPDEFSQLLRKNPAAESRPGKTREAYRYAKSSKFIMRSQLDCQDSRLPGSGVFDLKTRAVLPIRLDRLNIEGNAGYLIRSTTGLLESFEREYYDLIRSAFLKYNFQARIGAMDGIFLAYHNTARIFGFQYVPVKEMEERLYGPGSPGRGARIFEKCIGLMEALMEEVVACFPHDSLLCTINKRLSSNCLHVWVTKKQSFTSERVEIKELILTISHWLDRQPATAKRAIDSADETWTVTYKIQRSTRSQAEIWNDLRAAQAEADWKDFLPPGVSEEQARHGLAAVDWSAGLGFQWDPEDKVSVKSPDEALDEETGGILFTDDDTSLLDDSEDSSTTTTNSNNNTRVFASRKFTKTPAMIRHLRQLSRRGKEDMVREQEEGAKPVVWGIDHDKGSRYIRRP